MHSYWNNLFLSWKFETWSHRSFGPDSNPLFQKRNLLNGFDQFSALWQRLEQVWYGGCPRGEIVEQVEVRPGERVAHQPDTFLLGQPCFHLGICSATHYRGIDWPLPGRLEPASPGVSLTLPRLFQNGVGPEKITDLTFYTISYIIRRTWSKEREKNLLIDQIHDDIDDLVSLSLLSIILPGKTKLFGKEPFKNKVNILGRVPWNSIVSALVNLLAAVDWPMTSPW